MKRKNSLIFGTLSALLCIALFAACGDIDRNETEPSETIETVDVSETATTEAILNNETLSESNKEVGNETEMITDVMIGETIDAEYAADFTVAKIFSNDMVVQRNEHIRVWGFAPESENGKKVSGEFKGMFAEALIENGEWCLTFGARLEADTIGAEMKIYTDKKDVTFTGVLVGDIYLVMGQSNTAYSVRDHVTNTDAATQGGGRAAIEPNSIIRLNYLNGSGGSYGKKGTDYEYPDLLNTKFWTKTTENDTLSFSAIGYYFAREMVERSNNTVPVGLMEVAVGGAPLASFLPNELADLYGSDYYDPISGKYLSTISTEHQGRYLYNCYLAPVNKYAIAGVVWYQGESNNSQQNAMNYCKEFGGFIEYLRSTHNVINKKFPVFAVEFPSIYKKPAGYSGSATWYYMEVGIIRSYMGLLPTTVENCYIGASSDLWNDKEFSNNLHPNCKFEQAGRLADIAEAVIFGNVSLDTASGPVFKSAVFSEDKKTVRLTFINVGNGLTTADGGEAVKGLIGLEDKDFIYNLVTPVSANVVDRDTVEVVFDQAVKAVAYNYRTTDHFGETLNLCNSESIPAIAFITPYEEKDLGSYTADGFADENKSAIKKTGKSIDTLQADGNDLFPMGDIDSKLNGVGRIVPVSQGTTFVNVAGWIGFRYQTMMFGYSIDGGNAIFESYPIAAEAAVISAGGKYANRFSVNMRVSDLEPGEHTLTLLALIDLKDGTAVNILTFKINIVEPTPAPKGIDAPHVGEEGYGYTGASYDTLNVGTTELYKFNVNSKIEAAKNRVTVKAGTKNISFSGWIGFETAIDCFGYAIDGADLILETAPIEAEPAVLDLAGQYAKRYAVIADISELEAGDHSFDLLVKINTDDGTAVLKLLTFTLVVE